MTAVKAEIRNVSIALGGQTILDQINFTIEPHEQWAIIGPAGSGKTTLAKALAGNIFYRGAISFLDVAGNPCMAQVAMAEQQHRFLNLSYTSDFYYQQRYNSWDADQTMTVAQYLENRGLTSNQDIIMVFHLETLLDKSLIQLSNGENRRLQLAAIMHGRPDWLILDNPFVGLDREGRETLKIVLNRLSEQGTRLILISSSTDLPSCVTYAALLQHGRLAWSGDVSELARKSAGTTGNRDTIQLASGWHPADWAGFEYALQMKEVTVRYGDKTILDHVNWDVKKGQRWSLSGPNGSGKSTLLSLVNADNPQAYANEIWLFDRRRGTGESIWDIKKKTGYVSPELHLYFEKGIDCLSVVLSGWFDTIGLFRKPLDVQVETARSWMQLLKISDFENRLFSRLSASEQRMVLLARAFVKSPPLLILDEPCQGLDEEQTKRVNAIINQLCENPQQTLIYVSHYESEFPACLDHWLRLENGKIIYHSAKKPG
jgi:molybdate transport system ATP-binding protein